jgi:hypothetical protein
MTMIITGVVNTGGRIASLNRSARCSGWTRRLKEPLAPRGICLNRLRPDAEDDRDTTGTQTLEGLGDRLAARRRYQNDFGAAKRLQSLGGVGRALSM